MINFQQPIWILVGLIAVLTCFTFDFIRQKRRQEKLADFACQKLREKLIVNVSKRRRSTKNVLILLAIFFIFVAIARPQYGFQWIDVRSKGIDILFAIDTSRSMLAEDIKPNRLERARYAILDFSQNLNGDRVGLIPFAGSAYLMCPLTTDYTAFSDSVQDLDTNIIPQAGTNISAVIELAEKTLQTSNNHKILIILTDGENLQGNVIETATKAGENGMAIYTIGVGTNSGELIPTENGFLRDSNGKYVSSKLDEETLKKISASTGAKSVLLGSRGQGLEKIYNEELSLIPKSENKEKRKKVFIQRYYWPLGFALFLLILEMLIGEHGKQGFFSKRKKEVLTLFLLAFLCNDRTALADNGSDSYLSGDYISAGKIYEERLSKNQNDPTLLYNMGSISYKNNLYDEAINYFTKSLSSEDISLHSKAYYNLGNSFYKKGEESLAQDPSKTIESWKKAQDNYQACLELDKNNIKSEQNKKIVRKKLEELEKQQEKNQQNQSSQQDNKDEQNKQDQQGKQDQQNKQEQQNQQDKQDKQDKQNNNESSSEKQGSDEKDNNQKNTKDKELDKAQQEKENKESKATETPQAVNKEPVQPVKAQQDEKENGMSKKEAQRILEILRNEEGDINFVPSSNGTNNNTDKNW
ncbi:MAG: VWA domain-containing protein [Desulfotalea sp.]